MDNDQFDQLARIVGARPSRRAISRAVAGLTVGAPFALLGLAPVDARKSGKCIPACPVCQACQQGKCKKKHGKKKCKKGVCQPLADGAACANNPCQVCQGGTCVNKANATACNGTGQCINGTCIARPTCLGTGIACTQENPVVCCSGVCRNDNHCQNSGPGNPCLQTSDCITPAQCIGFVCKEA